MYLVTRSPFEVIYDFPLTLTQPGPFDLFGLDSVDEVFCERTRTYNPIRGPVSNIEFSYIHGGFSDRHRVPVCTAQHQLLALVHTPLT
jgi:hypothetical protein